MTDKFVCIRFYPNMEAKYTIRDQDGMESWKQHNMQARGGNSLFINGEYVPTTGVLKGEKLERVTEYCKAQQHRLAEQPIEKQGDQREFFGGMMRPYFGYGEEARISISPATTKHLLGEI